jgi:hypothetical protein
MTGVFDYVVWGVAAILLIPVVLNPAAWLFGAVAAGVWVLFAYGGREALEIEKSRRQGERGKALEVRNWGDQK